MLIADAPLGAAAGLPNEIAADAAGWGDAADGGAVALGPPPVWTVPTLLAAAFEAPVDAGETLEIYAFMEAADESKRRTGQRVTLKEVMEKAEKEAQARLASLIKN